MLTAIVWAVFLGFCVGVVVGFKAAVHVVDDRRLEPTVPAGIKKPKPVAIPYGRGGYQPIVPAGWDEKKLKIPTALSSGIWIPKS